MGNQKHVVIVGGGYGGVQAALVLEKKYRKSESVKITLIDRNTFHTLMTELHEVAGHRVAPESVQVPFKKIFGGRNVNLINDTVETVDFEKKEVITGTARLSYDYLVIGAGAEPEYFGIPGIQENSFSLWSFNDALKIRAHLEATFRKAETEKDPEKRKSLLTFVVAGAGFTGIEMAGELLEYRKTMCKKYDINKEDTRVIIVEALPSILPILEEPLRVKAEKYLHKMGCELMLNTPIVGAEKGKILLKDGSSLLSDTFIWTCGVMGARFAGMLDLTKGRCGNRACEIQKAQGTCGVKDCKFKKENRDTTGKRGRVLVNAEMRSVDYDNVFLVGDNIFFLENNKPLPQIVETAHQTADLAAHNIIASIEGKATKKFVSNYHGFMVSIGGRYGVANAGGLKTRGFFALAMKHLINMYYLFGIAGINQVWEYAKHEFLDIKEKRSLIGGFAVHKTRSYWTVLLRMWLGFMWIVEATNKITEGWLDFAAKKSASFWMFSDGVFQAGTKAALDAKAAVLGVVSNGDGESAEWAADAVTAATEEVVETVAEVVPGAVDGVVQAVDTWVKGPWLDITKPIFDSKSPLVTWFRVTFMDNMISYIPFEIFQSMVVFTELAIGLAIFGGCFTWWAAAASIVMCLVFTLSGMFAWNQLWFIFGAIMCLGGAGRALGLDYWVVPFFKKWWNSLSFVQRTRLYADQPVKKQKKAKKA